MLNSKPRYDFYLDKCLLLVEEKLQRGERQQWSNTVYDDLSEQLRLSSGISISSRTLKRLFGKDKSYKNHYAPQIATKNALSIYLGYYNWEDFISRQSEVPVQNIGKVLVPKKNYKKRIFLVGTLITSLSTIAIFIFFSTVPNNKILTGSVLKGLAPLRTEIRYNVTDIKSDRIYFYNGQFYSRIPKEKKETTLMFDYPGYYRLKITDGKRTVSSLPIHVLSEGWVAIPLQQHNIFYSKNINTEKGKMRISTEELNKLGLNRKMVYWVQYLNFKEYNIDGDNYILIARFKNSPEDGGLKCFDTNIVTIGEYEKGLVSFVNGGCSQYVELLFSELSINGEFSDLSQFTQDLSLWHTAKIVVRNKKVRLYLDDSLLYQITYRKRIGMIKGIGITFKGTGVVDYVKLSDHPGKKVYNDNF